MNFTKDSYAALFKDIPVALAIADNQGRYVDVNTYYCQSHGFAKEELLGKTPLELGILDPEQMTLLADAFRLQQTILEKFEITCYGKDRKAKVALFSVNPIQLDGREYFLVTLSDITEKKSAEQKLEDKTGYLMKITDHVPGMVFDYCLEANGTMKLEFVSRGTLELYGYEAHEIIADFSLLWNAVHPEDVSELLDSIRRSAQIFSHWEHEYRIVDKKGKIKWVYGISTPHRRNERGDVWWIGTLVDVSQKRAVEEDRKRIEQRLHKFVELTPNMAVQWYNSKGEVLYWNKASESLYGLSEREAMGKPYASLNTNALDPFQFSEETFSEKGPLERSIKDRNGKDHIVLTSMYVLPEEGEVVFVCTDFDITEQKRAQQALIESEGRLRAITELSPDFIRIIDTEGKSVYQSRESEFFDTDESTTIERIYPEDKAKVVDMLRQIRNVPGTVGKVQYRMKDQAGNYRWIETTAISEKENLAIKGLLIISRDISEAKKSENSITETNRLLHTLLNSIPVMVCWKDANSAYMGGNKFFLDTVKLSSTEELVGKTDVELFGEQQAKGFTEFDHEVFASKKAKVFYEDPLMINGEMRWLMKSKTPLLDETGKILGILVTGQDVTEQKKSQLALKESEYKYRSLFENMTSAFALHDMIYDEAGNFSDYRYLEINPAFERLTGVPAQALLGKTVKEVLPGTEQYWVDTFGQVAKYRIPFYYENFSKELGKWYDTYSFSPKQDQFAVIFNDSTARKEAEKALKESEEMFKGVVKNAPAVIYCIDRDGFFTLSEGQALEQLGLQPGEVVGLNVFEFYKEYPDVLDYIRGALEGRKFDSESNVGGLTFENRYTHTYDENGEVKSIICVSIDITDRKKMEKQVKESENNLSTIFNSLPDPIIIIRVSDSRIMEANPSFVRNIGISREELLTKYARELNVGYFGKNREAIIQEYVREGKVDNFEMSYFNEETGKTSYGLLSAHEIMFKGEICIISYFRDISDRKKAEQEIMRLNLDLEQKVKERTQQLLEANEEMEAYSYSISHDLRAPIRHIDGFVKLMYQGIEQPSDSITRYYQRVTESAKRMSQMIDDLLAFSRIGRRELQKTEVDLDLLVAEILNNYKDLQQNREIGWQIASLGKIQGDRSLLQMVFENLISNALKYTAKKEATRIKIGKEEKEDGQAEFFVEDNGTGFDMNHADRLFHVFQRLHTNDEFEGIGIGLANVRQIVKKHGGSVRAEGKVGEYAIFYVLLATL